jgi:hypothetical protein
MNAPAPSVSSLIDALTEQYRSVIAPLLVKQSVDNTQAPLQVADINEHLLMTKPQWLPKNDGTDTMFVMAITGKQVATRDCYVFYYERRAEAYDQERTDPFVVRVFTISPTCNLIEQTRVQLHPMMQLEVQRQLKVYYDEALHHGAEISGMRYLSILAIDLDSITKE